MSDRATGPYNADIAAAFREAAGLLRSQGANPFRVVSYEKAADTISNPTGDISEVAAGGIEALPQISSGLASAILELDVGSGMDWHLRVARRIFCTICSGVVRVSEFATAEPWFCLTSDIR